MTLQATVFLNASPHLQFSPNHAPLKISVYKLCQLNNPMKYFRKIWHKYKAISEDVQKLGTHGCYCCNYQTLHVIETWSFLGAT